MGSEQSVPSEVVGQSNTNVLVEQGMNKVDAFHSVLLILLLALVILQAAYLGFRHHQKMLKKKYLERQRTTRGTV